MPLLEHDHIWSSDGVTVFLVLVTNSFVSVAKEISHFRRIKMRETIEKAGTDCITILTARVVKVLEIISLTVRASNS